jgi:hypothetical protein
MIKIQHLEIRTRQSGELQKYNSSFIITNKINSENDYENHIKPKKKFV